MKKYYYGLWQNIYMLSWKTRFMIELIIVLLLIYCAYGILKKLHVIGGIKKALVSGIVFAGTECVFIMGKNKKWAEQADDKIVNWGNAILNGEKKKHSLLKVVGFLTVGFIYFSAVFVDLPFADSVNEAYTEDLVNVKNFYMRAEKLLSNGYEAYPPLLNLEKRAEHSEMANAKVKETEKADFYLQLNERGINGSNVRQSPSLDSEILLEVKGGDDIIYQDEYSVDGEMHWLKVYIPHADKTGWISGNLVEQSQREAILSDEKINTNE